MKKLKLGTNHCPGDGAVLEWRQFCGMRLVEQASDKKGYVYDARCPVCYKGYEVEAPRMVEE